MGSYAAEAAQCLNPHCTIEAPSALRQAASLGSAPILFDLLSRESLLRRISQAVDWKYELGEITRENQVPLLFENVKGYPGHRVFTNGLANFEAIALALGSRAGENRPSVIRSREESYHRARKAHPRGRRTGTRKYGRWRGYRFTATSCSAVEQGRNRPVYRHMARQCYSRPRDARPQPRYLSDAGPELVTGQPSARRRAAILSLHLAKAEGKPGRWKWL